MKNISHFALVLASLTAITLQPAVSATETIDPSYSNFNVPIGQENVEAPGLSQQDVINRFRALGAPMRANGPGLLRVTLPGGAVVQFAFYQNDKLVTSDTQGTDRIVVTTPYLDESDADPTLYRQTFVELLTETNGTIFHGEPSEQVSSLYPVFDDLTATPSYRVLPVPRYGLPVDATIDLGDSLVVDTTPVVFFTCQLGNLSLAQTYQGELYLEFSVHANTPVNQAW